MQGYWLHPNNTFSNSMDWQEIPQNLPDGVIFVEGHPTGLEAYIEKTNLELMAELFDSQPIEIRALFMDSRPGIIYEGERGRWDLVWHKINNTPVPPELQTLKEALLSFIPWQPPQ